jgi:hypothetical protein
MALRLIEMVLREKECVHHMKTCEMLGLSAGKSIDAGGYAG